MKKSMKLLLIFFTDFGVLEIIVESCKFKVLGTRLFCYELSIVLIIER